MLLKETFSLKHFEWSLLSPFFLDYLTQFFQDGSIYLALLFVPVKMTFKWYNLPNVDCMEMLTPLFFLFCLSILKSVGCLTNFYFNCHAINIQVYRSRLEAEYIGSLVANSLAERKVVGNILGILAVGVG